jgi:UTP--glucose-1-phosphate uridylyltransferase
LTRRVISRKRGTIAVIHSDKAKDIPMIMDCMKTADPAMIEMFRPFGLKMEELGIPPIVINIFKCYYSRLLYGAQGKLPENELLPLTDHEVPSYENLASYAEAGRAAMGQAVVIKLNGGLGTSMGLEKAKSLITVKDGMSFLDLILAQMRALREQYGKPIPILFMNSFKTHLDTMLKAGNFDNMSGGLPLAFLQHRYPKILHKDLSPATWTANPELEWNPPGHGDLYTALVTSKMLRKLLDRGIHYAFVSNSDNLGAVMDERLLGYMVTEEAPFLMEVAGRTASDRKGGHLARLKTNGRLVLREIAQCLERDLDAFQDITKHRFFNTNSLWLDLRAMEKVFVANGMMPLDLILNPKTLDPRDPKSPPVIQIETAMGSAVSAFENAQAVKVPRSRFAPVKTTADLLVVMSDCYQVSHEKTVVPSPLVAGHMPVVHLDSRHYKKIDDFMARFPHGAPSLIGCESLTVKGDVLFEAGVVATGQVHVINESGHQAVVRQDTALNGEVRL